MLRKYFPIILTLLFLLNIPVSKASLADNLSGRILLQVEASGEAWYMYPGDNKRYYLGRPADAFTIMQGLGIGISNSDLEKIPIGLTNYVDDDTDKDGLSDRLEESLETDISNSDSDGDGFSDKDEIMLGYNPNGTGNIKIDRSFASRQAGNIFIQTEKQGQAWYISPVDNKRYYLGRPDDAFTIMRELGLGITNYNISTLAIGYYISPENPDDCVNCEENGPEIVFRTAMSAIMRGQKQKALTYFVDEIKQGIGYTFDSLDSEGLYFFGNILSSAKLTSKTDTSATFTTTVKFNAWHNDHIIRLEKQEDGTWLIAQL